MKISKSLPENFNPERIVITMSKGMGVGDMILATPFFRAMKRAYATSYIAVLTSFYAGTILWGNPDINEIIIEDTRGIRLVNLYKLLKKGKFTLAIHICSRTEDVIAAFLAGIKFRLGPKTGFLHDYLINYRFQSKLDGWTDETHRVEYLMEYYRALGNNTRKPIEKLVLSYPPYADEEIIERMKQEDSYELNKPLILIHPGLSRPLGHFSIEFYLKLCKELVKDLGVSLLITGPECEYRETRKLIEELKTDVFDWVGKTSLHELCALIAKSNLVITHDTGPLHIAAALGIPVIALFGPKSAYSRVWKPYGVAHYVVESGSPEDCKICEFKGRCSGNSECKREISIEEVIEAARKLLGNEN
ncbi:MAG TPA: glycosyltransferase family 9 protein [Candidatus Eremiobacteraeota bacterium]|nr:MAG: ADP-heptose--LPS heptosyltransferase 2 [bacterium ADurb.Bin363]HPZ07888.1 glycosyltransferase family 9 protein [Candidatus Eremiobacteraeota bacterium]